jgi:hypothetical protein
MSIFCHPDVMTSTSVRVMLGIESEATPEFGFKPRTPLHNGKRDNTEIDMKLGQLLVKAKLTESDFQTARFNLISRYRDLEAVFDLADLPLRNKALQLSTDTRDVGGVCRRLFLLCLL